MAARSIPLEMNEVNWRASSPRAGAQPDAVHNPVVIVGWEQLMDDPCCSPRLKWWMSSMAPDLRRREGLPPPHTVEHGRDIWDLQEQCHWLSLLPLADIVRYMPARLPRLGARWLREPTRQPMALLRRSTRRWRFQTSTPRGLVRALQRHGGALILQGMQRNSRTAL
jgi:hypothetical protein